MSTRNTKPLFRAATPAAAPAPSGYLPQRLLLVGYEGSGVRRVGHASHGQPVAVFGESKHYLGSLCERGHDWQGTGKSRRSRRNKGCMACEAEDAKARRARSKAGMIETGG